MADWDPDRYLAFADHRLRPALDLLDRVPLTAPSHIIDLGCGTGTLTRKAAARWPMARVVGLDSSPDMLERARSQPEASAITWIEGDISTWVPAPGEAPDLILSNAALHWVGDHDTLFPRLLRALTPGGILAVQMPRNFDRPSHTLMKTVAAEDGPWPETEPGGLAALIAAPAPVDPPEKTIRRLAAAGATQMTVWETDYLQILEGGADAVASFTGSTALRPWLAQLPDPSSRDAFTEAYRKRLRAAYACLPDGRVIFPFRRQFLIASQPSEQ